MFGCPQSRSNPIKNIYSPIFPYFLFLLFFFSNKRFIHFFMAAFQNNVVMFKISVHDVYHKLFIAHSCREQQQREKKERRQTPSVWQTIGNINRIFFIVLWPAHDIRSQIQSVLIIYWYLQTNDDELNRTHYVSSSCAK